MIIKKIIDLGKKFLLTTKNEGFSSAFEKTYIKIHNKIKKSNFASPYDFWIARYDTIREIDKDEIRFDISKFDYKPLISIVMPVYNPNKDYLIMALDSVLGQIYDNWELCIADDASTKVYVKEILEKYRKIDSRIKIVYRSKNGHISNASNSALKIANGEYVAFMDHDDILPVHALYLIAKEIVESKNKVDLIYTDEDKIDANNRRYDPYFKSDWDQTLIFRQNFVAHLGVYKKEIINRIGGFRVGFEGSQDYDLLLRFLKFTSKNNIKHIPKILYHWRNFPGNHTFSSDNHNVSDVSAYKALKDYFKYENKIIKENKNFPGIWNVTEKLKNNPFISIIIPTKDKFEVLRKCIDSIIKVSTYTNYEIIIIDNNSTDKKTIEYLREIDSFDNVSIIEYNNDFNYSAMNNNAVQMAKGEYILLLNNDVEVITDNWMELLLQSMQSANIAVVGAKLLYPNDRVQHCGVTLGINGIADHAGKLTYKDNSGYFAWSILERNVSCVTGACLLIRKSVYQEVGGLDEKYLKVSYNDVDLCLKVINKGYSVIYNPEAILYHYESVSRGKDDTIEKKSLNRYERHVMYNRYGKILKNDPFYNPNLTLNDIDYSIADYPRIGKPWRNWIEFVCPFHRGDVLLGLQVAYTAYHHGINLRMHVSKDIIPWIKDFNCPFPIIPIPVKIPKAEKTYITFLEAKDYVARKEDSSGFIIGSHPSHDLNFLGLNIVENLMQEFGLSIDTPLENFLPENMPDILNEKFSNNKIVLIHPFGGWEAKTLNEKILKKLIEYFKNKEFKIIQIGGASDKKVPEMDDYFLYNENIGFWRNIFEKATLIVGVDSWSAHFAAILDKPQIIFYGSTKHDLVNSKNFFKNQFRKALIFDTKAKCAPCNLLRCNKCSASCLGYNVSIDMIDKYMDYLKI